VTLSPPAGTGVIRVMLCDDSATVRGLMTRLLHAEPDIRVVASAANGAKAIAMLQAMPAEERPQLVLLDLEMPVMDGMTALPQLLQLRPAPVVIVASALTQRGAAAAMAALRAGAADYVPKPSAAGGGLADPAFKAELLAKLRGWARMRRLVTAAPVIAKPVGLGLLRPPRAIGIGCSTGGPQALAALVRNLPRGLPVPLVVVQHMPAGFTTMLADHLNRLGGPPAAEARDGEPLLAGRIYVAPGERHLLVEAMAGGFRATLSDAPAENFCRPAVDPMLRSLAVAAEGRVLAVILTGMGHDGLAGCRAVAAAGGAVLAQDEASSVVWGMPGAVARAGLARWQGPPEALAAQIRTALGAGRGKAA
jgi:two-component system, chemotaxis family, protein-glutamate methylesterase/glutaminase